MYAEIVPLLTPFLTGILLSHRGGLQAFIAFDAPRCRVWDPYSYDTDPDLDQGF
jgi:hypothetical protein